MPPLPSPSSKASSKSGGGGNLAHSLPFAGCATCGPDGSEQVFCFCMNRTVNTCYVRNCFFCGRCFYRRHGSNRCAHCKRLQSPPRLENDRKDCPPAAAAAAAAAGGDAKGGGGGGRGKKKNKKKAATKKKAQDGGAEGQEQGGEEEGGMGSFSFSDELSRPDAALWDYEADASESPLEKSKALFSEVPYWGV